MATTSTADTIAVFLHSSLMSVVFLAVMSFIRVASLMVKQLASVLHRTGCLSTTPLFGFRPCVCVSGGAKVAIVAAVRECPAGDPVSAGGIAKQFLEVRVIFATFPKCRSYTEHGPIPRRVLDWKAKGDPFRLLLLYDSRWQNTKLLTRNDGPSIVGRWIRWRDRDDSDERPTEKRYGPVSGRYSGLSWSDLSLQPPCKVRAEGDVSGEVPRVLSFEIPTAGQVWAVCAFLNVPMSRPLVGYFVASCF